MAGTNQERIPKNQGVRPEAMKYIKQGITLLAAQLANEDIIEDYWLVTTPASIDHFGHVVAIITDENENQHALLVQTKLHSTKIMRLITNPETEHNEDNADIPLYDYMRSYNKIMSLNMNDEMKEKLKDIPRENFYFCLFTNMPRNVVLQEKNKDLKNVKLDLKSFEGNILNCFGSYAQCPQSAALPEEYKNFLKQFYIFAEQPNTQAIYKEMQEHIGKSSTGTIDSLCDVIESTMKEDEYCLPLTKIGFFEKCLETQLSQVVLF